MVVLKFVLTIVNSPFFTAALFGCYLIVGPKLIKRIKNRQWSENTAEIIIARLNMAGTFLLLFTSVTASGGGMGTPDFYLPFQVSLISPFIGLVPILMAHDMQIALLKSEKHKATRNPMSRKAMRPKKGRARTD